MSWGVWSEGEDRSGVWSEVEGERKVWSEGEVRWGVWSKGEGRWEVWSERMPTNCVITAAPLWNLPSRSSTYARMRRH